MRAVVRQFLTAAARSLDLAGPMGLVAADETAASAASWVRRQFPGKLTLECRFPARRLHDRERNFQGLPIERDPLRTILCLDLVERYEETAGLLEQILPRLSRGGVALVTADIGQTLPREGFSRVLTPLGLERLVAELDAAIVGWQGDVDFPRNLFLVACRSPVAPSFATCAGRFTDEFVQTGLSERVSAAWPIRFWRWLSRRSGSAARPATDLLSEAPSFSLHLPRAADWRKALLDSATASTVTRAGIDAR